jgi:hypothetical protein
MSLTPASRLRVRPPPAAVARRIADQRRRDAISVNVEPAWFMLRSAPDAAMVTVNH